MQIISGRHKGQKLFCPSTHLLRPTSGRLRSAIFNICQLSIENANFLDLFAGVGAMGLEALSRGAAKATFVEKSKNAMDHIQKNIKKLKEEKNTRCWLLDVFQALPLLSDKGESFDIIYADPPYGKDECFLSNEVLLFIDKSSLLKAGGELFLEDDIASQIDLPLQRLVLKSARNVGRSLLRHYYFPHTT